MIKFTKHFSIAMIGIVLSTTLLCACNNEKASQTETQPVPNVITSPNKVLPDNIKQITVSVLNLSNVEIGMFSVIDPASGEQVNLDRLCPGESYSLECNWPIDTQNFQWALYNMNGELCIDAATDISKAEKSVILVLLGDGTIEDVKEYFDDDLENIDSSDM